MSNRPDECSQQRARLVLRYRGVLLFFMAALVISGLTAIPLQWEMDRAVSFLGIDPQADPATLVGLRHWIATVRQALAVSYGGYPFLAYGTDWLAFAHFIIAIFFIGPLLRPGSERWVLTVGMIACVLVIPFALLVGGVRGIPLPWRLVDCAFGVFGLLPLLYCRSVGRRIALLDRPNDRG